jgi:predicted dehydrogenase
MNILIVGLGSIARKHIKAIRELNIEANLYALRSSKNASQEQSIKNIYHLEEITGKIDFAIIANPSNMHFQYIEILAKMEIPLFIEKPPLSSLQNADYLTELISTNNVFTYVACNLRFHPCILFLKDFLKQNNIRINEINVYCGSFLPEWRPERNFREIYSANPEMGGGVHLDLFHEIDYTVWLFGFPRRSSAIKRNVSSLNIKAVDYANYVLEYTNFTVSIILNYYRKNPKRLIEIVLDNGTIEIDLLECKILDNSNNILYKLDNFQLSRTYYEQMKYFVDSLKFNNRNFNSLKDSIEILRIVLKNE